jgi:hypothetical protein
MPALKLSIREYKGVFASPPQHAIARCATSVACRIGQTPTPQLAEVLAAATTPIHFLHHSLPNVWRTIRPPESSSLVLDN